MRVRKRELAIFVLLFLLIAGTACRGKPGAAGNQATVYKIGFIAAVTGPASTLGEPEGEVAAMLQKQLDAAGGIEGPDGVLHPVKIIVQDSEASGDVAVPIAKKLIDDEGVVAIVGDTTSPVSMALIPIVQEAQVPMISMASSSAIVEPVAERYWVFKSAQSNRHTAPWQVRYVKAKGLTKIANFYVNNAYGEDGRDGIRAAAAELGLEIVLEDSFGATDTDMTAQLTKLKASGAEALLVTATPPAASILTKQFHELGLTIPLVHNHGIGMASFITLSTPEAAEGVVFPMGKLVAAMALPDSDPQKVVLLDFMAAYEKETGKKPSTFAGHAWDATQLVLKGLATLPNGLSLAEQRAKLRDAIEGTKGFIGTAGTFNLSPQDHVGLSSDDIVMARITGGQWEYFPPDKW
ncbi:MAG: ABC transporter substrate-binding protein [Anaerolineae bacterium]